MTEPKELDENVISNKELDAALLKALPALSGAKFSSDEEADAYAVKIVRDVRASSAKTE